ncbi:MAG: DUF2062 domain-containing protein [Desulfobacteraceae bacterium]
MRQSQSQVKTNTTELVESCGRFRQWITRIKELHGDPHYVATGMAIGVFVSITPTIPFHTIVAVCLSLIFRGSKAAAAIGVWFSNPLTIPILYFASFKTGVLLFGASNTVSIRGGSLTELLELGLDVTIASISGGIILGILPGIATYFITRKIIQKLRYT